MHSAGRAARRMSLAPLEHGDEQQPDRDQRDREWIAQPERRADEKESDHRYAAPDIDRTRAPLCVKTDFHMLRRPVGAETETETLPSKAPWIDKHPRVPTMLGSTPTSLAIARAGGEPT